MEKTVIVCVQNDVEWRGRVYHRGMVYDGPLEEAPVDQPGWGQRPLSPPELSPRDNLELGGRVGVHWRTGPAVPTVSPVITGFDCLRDEVIVDKVATRQRQFEIDEMINRSLPKVSKDENFRRQLEYLQWAAPDKFKDYVEQYPEEAAALYTNTATIGHICDGINIPTWPSTPTQIPNQLHILLMRE